MKVYIMPMEKIRNYVDSYVPSELDSILEDIENTNYAELLNQHTCLNCSMFFAGCKKTDAKKDPDTVNRCKSFALEN